MLGECAVVKKLALPTPLAVSAQFGVYLLSVFPHRPDVLGGSRSARRRCAVVREPSIARRVAERTLPKHGSGMWGRPQAPRCELLTTTESGFAMFCHGSWKTAPAYATVSGAAGRNAEKNDDSRY